MNKVNLVQGFGCFLFRCPALCWQQPKDDTLGKPRNRQSVYRTSCSTLELPTPCQWAPSQTQWFSTHHPPVAWARLEVSGWSGTISTLSAYVTNSRKYPWKDLMVEHPGALASGPHATSDMHQLEALTQPITGRWACCTAPAWRAFVRTHHNL